MNARWNVLVPRLVPDWSPEWYKKSETTLLNLSECSISLIVCIILTDSYNQCCAFCWWMYLSQHFNVNRKSSNYGTESLVSGITSFLATDILWTAWKIWNCHAFNYEFLKFSLYVICFRLDSSVVHDPSYRRADPSVLKTVLADFHVFASRVATESRSSSPLQRWSWSRSATRLQQCADLLTRKLRFGNSGTFILPRCSYVTRRRSQRLLNVSVIVRVRVACSSVRPQLLCRI